MLAVNGRYGIQPGLQDNRVQVAAGDAAQTATLILGSNEVYNGGIVRAGLLRAIQRATTSRALRTGIRLPAHLLDWLPIHAVN